MVTGAFLPLCLIAMGLSFMFLFLFKGKSYLVKELDEEFDAPFQPWFLIILLVIFEYGAKLCFQ